MEVAGLLTAEISRWSPELPYRDLSTSAKALVVRAISSVWQTLLQEPPVELHRRKEPQITTLLQIGLNQLRNDPNNDAGFTGALFETVVRGAEMFNYNGTKLEKKPDLAFRLHQRTPGLPEYRGLFVECKIVGRSRPVGSNYAKKGLLRFVDGDYAWAMPSGMMLAYVYGGKTVPGTLTPFLKKSANQPADPYLTRSLPQRDRRLPGIFVSRHGRQWIYPGTGRCPGDVTIMHLWLDAE